MSAKLLFCLFLGLLSVTSAVNVTELAQIAADSLSSDQNVFTIKELGEPHIQGLKMEFSALLSNKRRTVRCRVVAKAQNDNKWIIDRIGCVPEAVVRRRN